jgi:N-methylhydantoinase B
MSGQYDPFRLEIMWGGLASIAEEMGVILKRTAYSEMVREANDFSCALFDHEGNMVAQTDYIGSPGHLGSVRNAVKAILAEYPLSTLNQGDSIITNDPYLVAGHLPDIALATPVFFQKEILGFALNITHHTDVGGRAAGGHIADSREIFEEGLRIPISKFHDRGEPNKDILRLIENNVRIPYKEIGDLNAQLSSNYVASKRLIEFISDFKLTIQGFRQICQQVLQRAEAAMLESYSEIRSGTYFAAEKMESFEGEEYIDLKLALKVSKDGLLLDFEGTGNQSPNGINSPYNYTYAYASHAVKCGTNPKVPMNEGVMKTIEVRVPEGSVLSAKFPAPVGGRHLTNWHVNSLVFKALTEAGDSIVIAPSGGTGSNMPQFSGMDSRNQKKFVQVINHSGGLGGRPNSDGISCYPFPARAENTPVEIVETMAPLTVRKLELLQDSGGAGRFRGGLGLVMLVRIDNRDGVSLLNISGRDRFAAEGILGGHEGSKTRILLKEKGKTNFVKLRPRRIVQVSYGDLLQFELPGGGGFGGPESRDPDQVLEDVRAGFVSENSAKELYKVVIGSKHISIEQRKTKQLRKKYQSAKSAAS